MAKVHVQHNDNYTVMCNNHFKERGMSLKAKGLLSMMLSLPDTWDYTIEGLTTLSKDGRDSVAVTLKELESYGYLQRIQTRQGKGRFANIDYYIFETPQGRSINAETLKNTEVLPITENPITVKPITVNPTQLSTNKSNTNSINKSSSPDNTVSKIKKEDDKIVNDVNNKINYQDLDANTKARADKLIKAIKDIVKSNKQKYMINGNLVPKNKIIDKLLTLSGDCLLAILNKSNCQGNPINYYVTMIYNTDMIIIPSNNTIKNKNAFNDFAQRNYTQDDFLKIEKRLLAKN